MHVTLLACNNIPGIASARPYVLRIYIFFYFHCFYLSRALSLSLNSVSLLPVAVVDVFFRDSIIVTALHIWYQNLNNLSNFRLVGAHIHLGQNSHRAVQTKTPVPRPHHHRWLSVLPWPRLCEHSMRDEIILLMLLLPLLLIYIFFVVLRTV